MSTLPSPDNWTDQRIRTLVAHARTADPRWSWKLTARPETVALLELDGGLLWHPDVRYGPLVIMKFDECEIAPIDLLWDIVMASPVDDFGSTPSEDVPTFWLDLNTGNVATWTENTVDELHATYPPAAAD